MTTEVKVVFAGVDQVGDVLNKVQSKMKAAFDKMKAASKAVGQGFEIGTKALAALGQAFEFAGAKAKALGRADVSTNIEKMNKAFDTLTNTLITTEVGGRDFLQWMGDAAEGAKNTANVLSILSIKFQQMTGSITDQEAAAKAAALVTEDLTDAQIAHIDATMATAAALEDARDQYDRAGNAAYELAKAEAEAKAATELSNDVYSTAARILADANIATATKIRLDTALKIASGELTIEEVARQGAIANLTQAYVDGKVSEQEYIDGMAELARQGELTSISLNNVLLALNALPDTKTITIQTVEAEGSNYGSVVEPAGGNPFEGIEGTEVPGGATGLHMVAPPGHANDSFFVRASSGEPIDIWRSQADRAAAMGGGGGGDISITVNVSQMPANVDARGMADMLSTQIARKVRALKNSHAQTIGQ